MSLIQEALRRQNEDRDPIGNNGEPGLTPPPVVFPPSPAPEKKDRKPWLTLVLLVIVIAVLLGAALGLLFYVARSLTQEAQKRQTQPLPEPGVEVSEMPAHQNVKEQTERPPVERQTPRQTEPETSSTEEAQQLAEKEKKLIEQIRQEKKKKPSEVPSIVEADKIATSTPVPVPVPVSAAANESMGDDWPELQLAGVLTKAQMGDSAAIINGEIIIVGERIHGVEVLRVEGAGVLLGYQGKKRFLRIGRTMKK